MRVPVIDKKGWPLMPTQPSRTRKWVRAGQAVGKFNKLGQYYVQLTFTPSGRETLAGKVRYISCQAFNLVVETDGESGRGGERERV